MKKKRTRSSFVAIEIVLFYTKSTEACYLEWFRESNEMRMSSKYNFYRVKFNYLLEIIVSCEIVFGYTFLFSNQTLVAQNRVCVKANKTLDIVNTFSEHFRIKDNNCMRTIILLYLQKLAAVLREKKINWNIWKLGDWRWPLFNSINVSYNISSIFWVYKRPFFYIFELFHEK